MNRYEPMERLGDGSFGEVMKARNLKTQEIVAIKKMKTLFPTWEECLQLRELKSLRVLRHENIVQLKEVIRDKEELYFVFEYMQSSLCKVMRQARHHTDEAGGGGWLTEAQIRSIMYQLFCGLAHMHKHGFFHRDIKPENLLCHDDTLKIADLGQAREIRSRPPFTDYVATRWYRSPELLLRATTYNSPIDLWACGCIMAELFLQAPLFPGASEADQIFRICKVLGTPTKENWPEAMSMASQLHHFKFPKCSGLAWKQVLPPSVSKTALQLIQDLLQYDPSRRLTASQALQHRFFDQHVPRPMLTLPVALSAAPVAHHAAALPPAHASKAEYKSPYTASGRSAKKTDEYMLQAEPTMRRREFVPTIAVSAGEALGSSRKYEGGGGGSMPSARQAQQKSASCCEDHGYYDAKATSAKPSSVYSSRQQQQQFKGGNDEEEHVFKRVSRQDRHMSTDSTLQDLLDEFLA